MREHCAYMRLTLLGQNPINTYIFLCKYLQQHLLQELQLIWPNCFLSMQFLLDCCCLFLILIFSHIDINYLCNFCTNANNANLVQSFHKIWLAFDVISMFVFMFPSRTHTPITWHKCFVSLMLMLG